MNNREKRESAHTRDPNQFLNFGANKFRFRACAAESENEQKQNASQWAFHLI